MILKLALLFSSVVAFAQHAGEHEVDPHLIPWATVGAQAYNFFVLIAVLIYLLRHAVIAHFKGRGSAYIELLARTKKAREEAERSHRDIAGRLKSLQNSANDSLKQAEVEAEQMKMRMIEEAKILAEKIQIEGKRTVHLEFEKAKAMLRGELLHAAIDVSKDSLKKSIGSSEQQRLQTEFAQKIQVVGT
jgi:F-type H+-transporting ATPase subunit b